MSALVTISDENHTSDSTDAEETVYNGSGGHKGTKPRRAVWVLLALSLCTLVGVTMVVLALCYRDADNTEPTLVFIKNQLKANGRALQDIIFTLMTSKMWSPAHDQRKNVASGPVLNDTITSTTSTDVTDMRMTDRIAEKLGSSTYQPTPLFNKQPSHNTEAVLLKTYVCEGNSLTMRCRSGKRINVVSALYGRMSRRICPGGVRTLWCQNPTSLGQVRSLCQGSSVCTVPASNSVFGDPCEKTYKYLEVGYTCTGDPVGHEYCPNWTPWYDRDDPTATGDYETLSSLRMEHFGQICYALSVTKLQARVKGSHVPAEQSGDRLFIFDPRLGLACRNEDQEDKQCEDYEVRFCCPLSIAAQPLHAHSQGRFRGFG
ncbi:hypothetical protein Bbelb_190720 [Branchiostoma belcheri]|nr:hypothetical protein Bbelb_190720 [Branchiostoma belcheri]